MTEHQPFLATIAADPANDSLRLVYADWLDEHGHAAAANYLRTELELARLPGDSARAAPLRERLWQAWANVEADWLHAVTQPRLLRANPTPFPSVWINFSLGKLRPGEGTYASWPYDSLPPLSLEGVRGEHPYFERKRGTTKRREFARTLEDSAELGVRLPAGFLKLMERRVPEFALRSPTDCFFALPDDYTRVRRDPAGGGVTVHFFCDSQSCVLWDLYVHASGAHCVIARDVDYYATNSASDAAAWFVAPSLEAFVYRTWLENQIWYILNDDFVRGEGDTPPPVTPALQAYMDHYRQSKRRAKTSSK